MIARQKKSNEIDWKDVLQFSDMQGLLVRGYKQYDAANYLFIQVADPVLFQVFLNSLVNDVNLARASRTQEEQYTKPKDTALQIAFTTTGLKKLGVDVHTFAREFKEGMNGELCAKRERATLLGDTKKNDSANWHWGNRANPVDCLLILFAKRHALADLCRWLAALPNYKKGFNIIDNIGETHPYDAHTPLKEHFGFRDGISQPIIKGLSKNGPNALNPGEFFLGYKNQYNSYSPSPFVDDAPGLTLSNHPVEKTKKDLGKNGTYLVFRQIEQHVETFWKFQTESREEGYNTTEKAITLASKMVGRWPEGQPITMCPYRQQGLSDEELQNFGYRHDPHGIGCPLGAHIRRTNPRDTLPTQSQPQFSMEVVSKHRMLRRGRIYGEPLDPDFNVEKMIKMCEDFEIPDATTLRINKLKRGLYFICLVSDISRQFEFVQNVWANTSTFANLCNEVDPLISPRPTEDQKDCHEFITPQNTIRNRYKGVPEFTTVVGGQYFFMPGITALKYIITRPLSLVYPTIKTLHNAKSNS